MTRNPVQDMTQMSDTHPSSPKKQNKTKKNNDKKKKKKKEEEKKYTTRPKISKRNRVLNTTQISENEKPCTKHDQNQ